MDQCLQYVSEDEATAIQNAYAEQFKSASDQFGYQ